MESLSNNINNKKLQILYVRHGETFDNIDGIIAGHKPGKLTKTGIQQAHITGKALKDIPFTFDHVYVSDLNRTRQTYEGIIQEALSIGKVVPTYTPLIREKCGGILEGKKITIWGENAKRDKLPIRTYKCSKAESWEDVNNRAKQFLLMLIREHLLKQEEKKEQLKKDKDAEFTKIQSKQVEKQERKTQDEQRKQYEKDTKKQDKKEKNTGKEKETELIRILVVTHGGFIMQTHNVMNYIKTKKEPVFNNVAKNCSFHEFEIGYSGKDQNNIQNQFISVECLKVNTTKY